MESGKNIINFHNWFDLTTPNVLLCLYNNIMEITMIKLPDNPAQGLTKEADIRLAKINILKENGINPYAPKFDITHSLKDARDLPMGTKVAIAGRMTFRRMFGKFSFIQLSDIYARIQVSLSVNEINEEDYKFFKNYIDSGDYVGIKGELYQTQTGEITVRAFEFKLLSKAMLPLPEKYHGVTDVEIKYRQRYLDLISNDDSKHTFITRSNIINHIRQFLVRNDFLEVETPILQSVACGAAAKPFKTKHNALDKEYNLRISPETYLKQVIAGGIPRVFEIAKNFRNEGMDAMHLQEFTMLEWYASYWDFRRNIEFVTLLLKELVQTHCGGLEIEYQGIKLNFDCEWKKVDYIATLNDLLKTDILSYDNVDDLKEYVKKLNIFNNKEIDEIISLGALFDYMYKRKIRNEIVQPTIVYNYPNLVPLARPSDENPKTIEMFQVLVAGAEIVKAYSELVDPIIQRKGFEEQMKNKMKGDEEAFELDEDFLLAMEHGMPPMSGLGLGIDRLVAILCNQPTLRDIILFPNMK